MVEFFSRLSKEDIIELINRAMAYDESKGAWGVSASDRADEVLVYNEEDRRDENGNRYAWVRGISNRQSNLPKYFASFRISDFYMCYGDNLPHDYDNILRAFMTEKFREEYIKALHAHRVSLADTEAEQLTEYLQMYNANNPSRN